MGVIRYGPVTLTFRPDDSPEVVYGVSPITAAIRNYHTIRAMNKAMMTACMYSAATHRGDVSQSDGIGDMTPRLSTDSPNYRTARIQRPEAIS